MKHEDWYELEVPPSELMKASRMSNSSMGRVHLVLKWIFCREKYLETGIKRLEEALNQEVKQLNNLSEHLSSYILPFKNVIADDDYQAPSTGRLTYLAENGDTFAKLVIQEKAVAAKVD